jgi:16S rRNA (guanine527-N7)-methyltransferase
MYGAKEKKRMKMDEKLAAGLVQLDLQLDAETRKKLLAYLALLAKWNKVYNLTAIREPQQMLTHHILDSLAVLPFINGHTLLDVGSGAGLPGIPLALARPDLQVTLLDSNHKKTIFLRQVCIELGLTNVSVVCERVEAWQPPHRFDTVISRAFSDLVEFVRLAGHLCRPGGSLLGMKGLHPYDELAQLPPQAGLQQVVALDVPGLEAQRHLVVLKGNEP